MLPRHWFFIALAASTLAACQRASEPPPAAAASVVPPAAATVATTPPPQVIASAPLLHSQQAVFDGELSCDGCSSDATHLMLQRDELGGRRYVLQRTIERDGKTSRRVESGTWRVELDRHGTPPIAVVTLDSGRPGQEHVFTIALDGSLEPLTGDVGQRLKRGSGDLDLSANYTEPTTTAATPSR